jgi:hypothetical protein
VSRLFFWFFFAPALIWAGNAHPAWAGKAESIAVYEGDNQVATAGAPAGQPLRVIVRDAGRKPSPGAVVEWKIQSGDAKFTAATSVSNAEGIAEAVPTMGRTPGEVSVQAFLHGTKFYAPFKIAAIPNTAAVIEIKGGNGQSRIVGATLRGPLEVVVKDAFGNPLPRAVVDWSIPSGSGTLSATMSSTDARGVTGVNFETGHKAGIARVQARLHDAKSAALFTVTATAGAPAKILFVPNPMGWSYRGGPSRTSLRAKVTDEWLNPIADTKVDWSVRGGRGRIFKNSWWKDTVWRWQSGSSKTDRYGIAAADIEVSPKGVTTFAASVRGTHISQQIEQRAQPVPGGGERKLQILSGNSQTRAAGSALDEPLIVQVHDGGGKPYPDATIEWSVIEGGGALNTGTTKTDAKGIAQISLILGPKPGLNKVMAKLRGSKVTADFVAHGASEAAR